MDSQELASIASRVRRHIIRTIHQAGSGHPGGSLSCVEILVALYFSQMRIRPNEPEWEDRDRLVLSKGHACPALYAVLAERGFFPVEELDSLRKLGSMLQGHPDMKRTPGVEASTGSLGQGLSQAVGMALALKLDGSPARVYVLLGDGEVQEGQVWEAAMAAAHYRLDNLTAILDLNGLQIDGRIDDVMSPLPLLDKWKAFNWAVHQCDGHDLDALTAALSWADGVKGAPAIIVAKTVKGRGVSFMENVADWHGKAPDAEKTRAALSELGGAEVGR
ncbi:MAG: transketolase [Bacillota bacterium]